MSTAYKERPIWRSNRVLFSALTLMTLSALGIVVETFRIRAEWPPAGWPFSHDLPFVTPGIVHSQQARAVVMSLLAAWSIGYLVSLKAFLTKGPQKSFPTLIVGCQVVLLGLTLCAAIPFNSDQYLYVGYSELVHMRANPYSPPLKREPVSTQLRAISTVWGIDEADGTTKSQNHILLRSRYGPLWSLGSAVILAPFGHSSIETKSRVLRAAAAGAAVLCSLLLWIALRTKPWGRSATAAFALSPSVVQQTALGAHNDIYALLFGLMVVVLVLRRRHVLAAVAFAASVGVKLSFAPLLPAFIAYVLARRGVRSAVASLALFGVALAALALPFGLRESLLQPIQDVRRFNPPYAASFGANVLRHIPGLHAITAEPFVMTYSVLILICAGALAVAAARCRRLPALEAVTLLLIFAGAHFEPWYAMLLVPLLLIPSLWALPFFAGVTLASQVFEAKEFAGTYDQIPFVPFLVLSIVCVPLITLFLMPARTPGRPEDLRYATLVADAKS